MKHENPKLSTGRQLEMNPEKPTRPNFIDLTGRTFGRLTVIGFHGTRGKSMRGLWRVQCSCGSAAKVVDGSSLRGGQTTSCGCFQSEMAKRKSPDLTINGETKTVAEWARVAGISGAVVRYRLRAGWDPHRAVFCGLYSGESDVGR